MRGDVSNVSVERTFSKRKGDRDFEHVATLSGRENFQEKLELNDE